MARAKPATPVRRALREEARAWPVALILLALFLWLTAPGPDTPRQPQQAQSETNP